MDNVSEIQVSPPSKSVDGWVRETWFGRQFLKSNVWFRYVLSVAVTDFELALARANIGVPKNGVVLDAGCGHGLSIPLIESTFSPKSIIAMDLDEALVENAKLNSLSCKCDTTVLNGSVIDSGLADNSIDIAFCHQLLHHTAKQEELLREMRRILKPGGLILVAESCREFIHSYLVRYLFAHPMHAQQTAESYLQMVRSAGFIIPEAAVQISTPWWSKPDLGLKEKWGFKPINISPTEVLFVGVNP